MKSSQSHFSVALIIIGVFTALLSTPTISEISLAGSNASNARVFGMCFDDLDGDGVADPRISSSVDGGVEPVSLAFYLDNQVLQGSPGEPLKLLVADNKGKIIAVNWPDPESNDQCDFTPYIADELSYHATENPNGPQAPNGLAIDGFGNLFLTSSQKGNNASELWRFNLAENGLSQPSLIDGHVQVFDDGQILTAQTLEDTLMLPNGNLLVVSSQPAAILLYDAQCLNSGAPCTATTYITSSNLQGIPAGIAFAPEPFSNKLLVSLTDGEVAVFDVNILDTNNQPSRQLEPFISGLNSGKFKIKAIRTVDQAINQSYSGNLYLSGRNNGRILQIAFQEQNGQLTAPKNSQGDYIFELIDQVQFPVGIAATDYDSATAGDCDSSAGCQLVPVIEHQLTDNSLLSGAVGETYQVFKEPREICGGNQIPACPLPTEPEYDPGCSNSLSLKTLNPNLEDVFIPEYFCGSPNIILVDAVSTITVIDGIVEHSSEQSNLSPFLDCYSANRADQPIIAWATKQGEPAVVEGSVFQDSTTGCGSSRAITKGWSYFITGLRYEFFPKAQGRNTKKTKKAETQQFANVIANEVANLQATFEEAQNDLSGNCVNDPNQIIADKISSLVFKFNKGQYAKAQQIALDIENTIATQPEIINPSGQGCSENYRGELRARANHIWYNINSKVLAKIWGSY